MSVTVDKTPLGFVLGTCVEATIDEQYAGFAVVNKVAHGLVDGDYIYIQSDVESYNGFWYVNAEGSDYFKIRETSGSPDEAYVVDASITYCPVVFTHGYQCVHLPITYKLSSDLFPTNEVDTSRTISSFENDNGYVNLNLSGSIDDGAFPEPFEAIRIAGSTGLDGVYRIIEVVSTTSITINLLYDSTYSFGSATVIREYENYTINVKVYGGIRSEHTWTTKKPYELLATLEFIPDSNNQVFFSINEILKAKIFTKNNLQLDTLPNNIDAWCNFYISYNENYDDSLGSNYTLSRFESEYTDDTFTGTAVNAMLPFKNIHSGHLSEYVMKKGLVGLFLTLFSTPVLFQCDDGECYQDISFILETLEIENVSFVTNSSLYSNGDLSGTAWTIDSTPEVTTGTNSTYLKVPVSVGDADYTFTIGGEANLTGGAADCFMIVAFLDANENIIDSHQEQISGGGGGIFSDVFTITGSEDVTYLAFYVFINGPATYQVILQSYSYSEFDNYYLREIYYLDGAVQSVTNNLITDYDAGVYRIRLTNPSCNFDSLGVVVYAEDSGTETIISEEKTFDINCDCSSQTYRLCWLNHLGGFDYWTFTAEADHNIEVLEVGEQKNNILTNWPKSYGEYADTIEKETYRDSKESILIRSQVLTESQAEGLKYIKSSPLVQIVNSKSDRRTVKVDQDSFRYKKDRQKNYEISFTISYTDNIPSQRA